MVIAKSPDTSLEFEITNLEYSRIFCSEEKIIEDEIKLFRECNTCIDFAHSGCDKLSNEFGIIGIQVAGGFTLYNT